MVHEVTHYEDLASAIEEFDPEWVIISLPSDHVIPEWVDVYIANRPSLRFLAVSTDGSKIKMKWLEPHEEDLGDLSLKGFNTYPGKRSTKKLACYGRYRFGC